MAKTYTKLIVRTVEYFIHSSGQTVPKRVCPLSVTTRMYGIAATKGHGVRIFIAFGRTGSAINFQYR